MGLSFRNVQADPADPVESWPAEAIGTALERGGLREWRRLAAAIDADPWGRVARCVEEQTELGSGYGTGPLMADVLGRARDRAQVRERAAVAAEVARLVALSGLTQADFAVAIGTSASRLSTYVRGSVVPSASLMVRMRHAVERQGGVPAIPQN